MPPEWQPPVHGNPGKVLLAAEPGTSQMTQAPVRGNPAKVLLAGARARLHPRREEGEMSAPAPETPVPTVNSPVEQMVITDLWPKPGWPDAAPFPRPAACSTHAAAPCRAQLFRPLSAFDPFSRKIDASPPTSHQHGDNKRPCGSKAEDEMGNHFVGKEVVEVDDGMADEGRAKRPVKIHSIYLCHAYA